MHIFSIFFPPIWRKSLVTRSAGIENRIDEESFLSAINIIFLIVVQLARAIRKLTAIVGVYIFARGITARRRIKEAKSAS